VSAKDKGSGREQKITIQASSGLSKDEIARMQREAELHADEDRRKRDLIELKNVADNTAYQAEKTLRDNADKVAADLKAEVEARVKDVREALAAEDEPRIRTALDALSAEMQKIGEAVYASQAAQGAPAAGPAEDGAGEGTVEGEFREV
jgi:molecular chaperone DnaK